MVHYSWKCLVTCNLPAKNTHSPVLLIAHKSEANHHPIATIHVWVAENISPYDQRWISPGDSHHHAIWTPSARGPQSMLGVIARPSLTSGARCGIRSSSHVLLWSTQALVSISNHGWSSTKVCNHEVSFVCWLLLSVSNHGLQTSSSQTCCLATNHCSLSSALNSYCPFLTILV